MKIFVGLVLFFISVSTHARDLGVGLMLGNPTGVNGKYWLNEKHAIDGGIGVSFGDHQDGNIFSDYLIHNKNAFYLNDVYALDLYYGAGGRMEFADSIELGLRAPVGLTHMLKDQPADLFAEVAPTFDVIGKVGIELGVAVGARYYLK